MRRWLLLKLLNWYEKEVFHSSKMTPESKVTMLCRIAVVQAAAFSNFNDYEERVLIGNYILAAAIIDPESIMPRLAKLKSIHFEHRYQTDFFIMLRHMYETNNNIDLVSVKDKAIECGTWKAFGTEKKMILWLMGILESVPLIELDNWLAILLEK